MTDTAGINNSKRDVDKLGIQRSYSSIKNADMVILVTAANEKTSVFERDIIQNLIISRKPVIGIINKTDLNSGKHKQGRFKRKIPFVCVSLLKNKNQKALYGFIEKQIKKQAKTEFVASIFQNMRHEKIARELIGELDAAIAKKAGAEISAYHLKMALKKLEEFLGTTAPQEILDSIFSKFCIGK